MPLWKAPAFCLLALLAAGSSQAADQEESIPGLDQQFTSVSVSAPVPKPKTKPKPKRHLKGRQKQPNSAPAVSQKPRALPVLAALTLKRTRMLAGIEDSRYLAKISAASFVCAVESGKDTASSPSATITAIFLFISTL